MKRIICTVTNDLTYDQRMIRICTSLARGGYRVMLVGRQLAGSRPLARQPFQQKRFRLLFNKGKLFYMEFNIRLFIWLLFSRFDVVNAVDLDTLLPGFLAARLKRKICVYDAHEFFTEVPEVVERPLVKKAWESIALFIIPRLSYCYTVGECLSEVFTKKYGVPFSVIRNVPITKSRPHKDFTMQGFSPFIVLYQGVLNEGRGLEEAIAAMGYLDDAELWLAGEGDLSGMLRELAAQLGLNDKVKFLGRLPPKELAEVTAKAHLGLNLLKNKGLNYYYSLANKAFDYIQAGVPSLNMAFPEYEKINQRHGVFQLMDTLEPKVIAETIAALRTDKGKYIGLVERCRKAADLFTWEKEEEQLLALYGSIFKEP